jgi:DNA-binding NarL/FixJ family response regulator
VTVTRQIKSSYPEAHVCIVTDHDDVELRAAARAAGAEDYIVRKDLFRLRQVLATPATRRRANLKRF